MFARGLVALPDHKRLLRELRLLDRHTHRSGRDTVDHGKNGSDDYSDTPSAACPYVKQNVAIDGQTPLEEITLSRVTSGELLPSSPEIAAQMTGSEWLASLSAPATRRSC